MQAPLKIHCHREVMEGMTWHTYAPSRAEFTLEELKNAPIVPRDGEVKLSRHTRSTITVPPYHRVREQNDGTLMDEDVFPYGWVKPGLGKKGNQEAHPLLPTSQGFSATLNQKVYGHLLKTFPPDMPVRRNRKTSNARDKELKDAGLNPDEVHTLQQRYDAFLRREKELEEKNKTA